MVDEGRSCHQEDVVGRLEEHFCNCCKQRLDFKSLETAFFLTQSEYDTTMQVLVNSFENWLQQHILS